MTRPVVEYREGLCVPTCSRVGGGVCVCDLTRSRVGGLCVYDQTCSQVGGGGVCV